MPQITINEGDNDRLKTRKVRAMLIELGVWPARENEQPSFLRSRRRAAILIDRALATLAPSPRLVRCTANSPVLVEGMNEKFASANWPGEGGGEVPAGPDWVPAGAIAHIDWVSTPARAWVLGTTYLGDLSAILGTSDFNVAFAYDPEKVVPGVGYTNAPNTATAAFIGPLADAFANEFTVLADFDDILTMEYVEETFYTDLNTRYSDIQVSGAQPGINDDGNNSNGITLRIYDGEGTAQFGTTGAHKFAWTFTAANGIYAASDGVGWTTVDGETSIPTSSNLPPTEILLNAKTIRSYTVYSAKSQPEAIALTAA
jgi:hypothetical protein